MKVIAQVLLLSVGLGPAFSWTVPVRFTTRQPQSRATSYSFTRVYADQRQDDEGDAAAQAQILREKAEKVRREAQEMEKSFVEQKMATLEKLLEKQSSLSPSEQQDIQDKIDRLKNYQKPRKDPVTTNEEPNITLSEANENLLDALIDSIPTEEYVGELSDEDRKVVEEIQSIFLEFQDAVNLTSLLDEFDDEFVEDVTGLGQDLENALEGNITQDDLEILRNVTSMFANIPFMNANGLKEVLLESSKVFVEELAEIKKMEKVDPYYSDRLDSIGLIMPDQMVQTRVKVNETDIKEFVDTVMIGSEEVFEMKSKPRKLGPYYVLEGTPLVDDGNVLLDHLDRKLTGALRDRLQFFYLRDPSALAGLDEVQIGDMVQEGSESFDLQILKNLDRLAPAHLLVIPAEQKADPSTSLEDRVLLSSLALLSAARFVGFCYNPDGKIIDQIFSGLSSPTVLFGLFGLTIVHELGHFVAATLNEAQVAFPPFLIPSRSTGLLYTHTQLKSPPKDNKVLFDFALSGPLLGMTASWGMLAYGLLQTALAKTDQIASFPHIPFDFLNLSYLTSATIESLIGTDVLLSLDPVAESGVAVHPLVLAGHVGILMNALSLLPNSPTSDGGRMLQAAFTKTGTVAAILPSLFNLFLWVQGFRDWKVSGMLILYAFVSGALVNQKDVPCRNSVDPAGPVRLAFLVASTLGAVVAVSPAF